jgi:hypothetical protein
MNESVEYIRTMYEDKDKDQEYKSIRGGGVRGMEMLGRGREGGW